MRDRIPTAHLLPVDFSVFRIPYMPISRSQEEIDLA